MDRKFLQIRKKAFFCILWVILCLGSIAAYAQETELSKEEQTYVEEKGTIRVAIVDDWLPLSSKTSGEQMYQGLSVDILEKFGSRTGLKIEYIEAENYRESIRMTEDGETDITAVAVEYSYSENLHKIHVSETYLEAQMMMLYNKGIELSEEKKHSVAEIDGYPNFSSSENVSYMFFDTLDDCILAVRSYQADMMYCDIFTGMIRIRQYKNRDLCSFPINTEKQFKFGISQTENPVLEKMLNETITGMNRKEINESLTHNRGNDIFTLGDFLYYYFFEVICVVLTAAALIVMVFVEYTRIKSRQSIAQQGYAQSYSMLADAFGEAAFSYDYIEDKMTIFGKYGDKLSMPSVIENFSAYLEDEQREISLTKEQLEHMLRKGMLGEVYDINLECKLRTGEWEHFRLVFSVTVTDESYKRPICMVGCLINIEEDYKEKKRLLYIGMYDKLTGLYNRMGGDEAIKKLQEEGSRKDDMLLIVDVDFFKNFNDIYGHQCGDDVLMYVGNQLRTVFREDDILCRWGGDEFLLYLIGAGKRVDVIERRCAALKNIMKQYEFEGRRIPVTLSIGGVVVGGKSIEETFQAADKALYAVKEAGRDSAFIASE